MCLQHDNGRVQSLTAKIIKTLDMLLPSSASLSSSVSRSNAPLSGLKQDSFHLCACSRGGRADTHVVSLATLAGLHNHIGQLLHLKVEISICECCVHMSPDARGCLAAVWVPCVACPRSRGLAVTPVPRGHSRVGQRLLDCDACTVPKSVNR